MAQGFPVQRIKLKEQIDTTPVGVIGRLHYACLRCKAQKIKCSGDKPSCSNCIMARKGSECSYPNKDRKVIILESQLDKLTDRIKYLETVIVDLVKEPDSNSIQIKRELERRDRIPDSNMTSDSVYNPSIKSDVDSKTDDETEMQYLQARSTPSIPFIGAEQRRKNNQTDTLSADSGKEFEDLSMKLDSAISLSFGDNDGNAKSNNKVSKFLKSHSKYYLPDSQFKKPIDNQTSLILPSQAYALKISQLCLDFFQSQQLYCFDHSIFVPHFYKLYEDGTTDNQLLLVQLLLSLSIGEQIYYSLVSNKDPDFVINKQLYFQQNNLDSNTPGLRFFKQAMEISNYIEEDPSLTNIQNCLLIAYYSQSLNRITTSYAYLGLATRLCLVLGLHTKYVNTTNNDVIYNEKRKRVWWTTFILDSFATSRVRLPQHITFDQTDIELPTENFLDLGDGFDGTILQRQVQLGKFAGKILSLIYNHSKRSYFGDKNTVILHRETTEDIINNTLACLKLLEEHFERNLKEDFIQLNRDIASNNNDTKRPLIHLFLKFNQYIITTTRPLVLVIFKKYLAETEQTRQITSRCILAACHSIDLLYQLRKIEGLPIFDYWDTHFCFSSVLILMMAIFTGKSYSQLDKGVELLKYMANCGNHVAKDNFIKLRNIHKLFEQIGLPNRTTVDLTLLDDDINDSSNSSETASIKLENQDNVKLVLNPRQGPTITPSLNEFLIPEPSDTTNASSGDNVFSFNGSQFNKINSTANSSYNDLSYLSTTMDSDLANQRYHFTPYTEANSNRQSFGLPPSSEYENGNRNPKSNTNGNPEDINYPNVYNQSINQGEQRPTNEIFPDFLSNINSWEYNPNFIFEPVIQQMNQDQQAEINNAQSL
ncbi:hypothetical protein LJB42_003645 [Komagataella kurtzmanii]|nr:hypothetical protein LJB42_003645 [Komagataella kurtzmanii]